MLSCSHPWDTTITFFMFFFDPSFSISSSTSSLWGLLPVLPSSSFYPLHLLPNRSLPSPSIPPRASCGGCGADKAITTTCLSIAPHACIELVEERLGVKLPASPPPGPQRPDGRRPKNAAKLQQKKNPSRSHQAGHDRQTLHSLHCAYQSLLRNKNVLKRRDELNLMRLHILDEGLLEHVANDHRDVHNRSPDAPQSCPVFIYRPGLAVSPSGRVHWVRCVPDSHQKSPLGPEQWHHSQPSASKCRDSTTDDNVCWMTQSRKEGTGTSTNCSALCSAKRTRRVRD